MKTILQNVKSGGGKALALTSNKLFGKMLPLVATFFLLFSATAFAQVTKYNTGFETDDGFTAGSTYNNQTESLTGTEGKQWATVYGTPTTADKITDSQSLQMRIYKSQTIQPYTRMDFDLTNIEVTSVSFQAKYKTLENSVTLQYSTDGGTSWEDAETFTLTTTATTYTYAPTASIKADKIRFKILVDTYTTATSASRVTLDDFTVNGNDNSSCASPVFSVAAGTFIENFDLTISCSTEGANIYYTTDGTDPTESSTLYNSAISISETTTVKAIAVDPNGSLKNSSASATYTKLSVLSGVSGLRTQVETDNSTTEATYAVDLTDAVVTYVNGSTAIIEQDGKGIMLYYSGHGLTAGDVLSGTATVKAKMYNGYAEITSALDGVTTTSGTAPDPTVVTVSNIQTSTSTYLCRYVKVENATVGTAVTSSNRNGTITDSSSETALTLRSNSSSLTADADATVNVTGVVVLYSSNPQIVFYEQSQIEVLSQFSFSAETATAVVGQDFTAPTLTNTYTATVTYSSSDESVATVDSSEGTVTPVAAGETTITASDGTHSASYTLTVYALTGNGTFENAYTVSDVNVLNEADITVSDAAWVVGTIIGSVKNATALYDSGSAVNTNIALSTDESTTTGFIAVQLSKGNLRNIANVKDHTDNVGKKVKVYGTLTKYITNIGVKSTSKIYGLTTMEMNAEEGYSTFYDTCAYEMPEGLQGGVITGAEDGVLTISYDYSAGDVVPACTSLLIKAEGNAATSYNLVNTSSTAEAPTTNLLHGADAVDDNSNTYVAATNGGTVRYYVLTYSEDKSNYGFYWAAEDGAAVAYVSPHAFLAVETTSENAVKGFSLDGTPTSIAALPINGQAQPAAVYTIAGQRVNATNTENLPRGLYIVGGKKVFVK